jgi:hypothetical protein
LNCTVTFNISNLGNPANICIHTHNNTDNRGSCTWRKVENAMLQALSRNVTHFEKKITCSRKITNFSYPLKWGVFLLLNTRWQVLAHLRSHEKSILVSPCPSVCPHVWTQLALVEICVLNFCNVR